MRLLLLGSSGYLGSYLSKNLPYNIDLTEKYDSYDFIINCVGRADLDWCEANPKESTYSNLTFIVNRLKDYPSSKYINFSSYYVYDADGLCSEDSNTTSKYAYTSQKLELEKAFDGRGITFRIGKLFGNSLSIQNKLTEYIITNKGPIVIDLIKFNPTSVLQVKDAIIHYIKGGIPDGVYNLSNKGYTTHFDYATYILGRLGLDKQLIKSPSPTKFFANYGRFCMSTRKLESYYTGLRPWECDMDSYLKEITNA